MGEIATKKKPVFVQANSNSGQGHVLHYITSFCVLFRLSTLYFWLAGKTETKQVVNRMSKWVEGGGSWKGHESGQAVFIFLAATPLLRPARQNRHATQATTNQMPCMLVMYLNEYWYLLWLWKTLSLILYVLHWVTDYFDYFERPSASCGTRNKYFFWNCDLLVS